MHPGDLLYRAAARVAPAALRAAAPFSDKLARALAGRRDALASMLAWARAERDDARPLLWLHAPSVGEALMAQAILAAARARRPELQAAFTWFSPSAERVAARVGADWSGYLPWDRTRDMQEALAALRPEAVGFVRTEIWPTLVAEAGRRRIRTALVNAALGAQSSRTRPAARLLLGAAYRRLDAIGAVHADDADRFGLLGVDPARVHVTGDARIDQVWQRVQALRPAPLLAAIAAAPGPWLVAGSTWSPDEAVLLHALQRLHGEGRRWRAIIAPHEPEPRHLAALERRLRHAGLSHARLPDLEATDVPAGAVLVVDRVGVLADLYTIADVAWVGGGFGTAGLHSVVEPAALGVPVMYGPHHGNAQEAKRLAAAGGGRIVEAAGRLADTLREWSDGSGRSSAGAAAGASARAFVQAQLGSADRNAALLLG